MRVVLNNQPTSTTMNSNRRRMIDRGRCGCWRRGAQQDTSAEPQASTFTTMQRSKSESMWHGKKSWLGHLAQPVTTVLCQKSFEIHVMVMSCLQWGKPVQGVKASTHLHRCYSSDRCNSAFGGGIQISVKPACRSREQKRVVTTPPSLVICMFQVLVVRLHCLRHCAQQGYWDGLLTVSR